MGNKEKNFVSAVVYVHNVEERISDFIAELIDTLERNFENSEIICVNDCSDDNSVSRIRDTCKTADLTSVSILNMSYYHGLELAMNAGRDLAIGDFVFEFDDIWLEYGSEEIMKVYFRMLEGYDIVSAVPAKKQRVSSKLFYRVFNRFTGLTYQIQTESFRILSRRVINRIGSMNRVVLYRKAVYANCGLRTDHIEYPAEEIRVSPDKTEKRYRGHLAVNALIMFTDLGYRFAVMMTLFMMVMAALMMIYSSAVYLTRNPVKGWTTTILFLSVAFFGLFGVLTIVIKYLQLLLDLTFKRQQYSFESIEKITI